MSFLLEESAASQHPVPGHLASYPTPFHVFHEAEALEDARNLKNGLISGLPRLELYYSVKTNPLLPLLRALLGDGWGLEVVGAENLRAATNADCPGQRILFNGAAWSRTEIENAIFSHGIRNFTVDSRSMARILAAAVREKPNLRNLNIALRIHDGNSHFGIPPNSEALLSVLKELPVSATLGLHIHVNPPGSALTLSEIEDDFKFRCVRIKDALAALAGTPWKNKIDYLDLGGGIDSPFVFRPHPGNLARFHDSSRVAAYRSEIASMRFSLREAGSAIASVVRSELGSEWASRRIILEPGRSVCTRAMSTWLGVRAVKEGFYPDAQVLVTDGNTAFLGPLHRGMHPLLPKGSRNTFVYGGLPHSGDWLFQSIPMPELRENDRMLIQHTGAYFLALEAAFGHSLPSIIHAARNEKLR